MIADKMNLDFKGLLTAIDSSAYSQWFFWEDWGDSKHFIRQFFSGMFITIVMTGLDQDMMQKNLSCANIKDAQKNMVWFSIVLFFVNIVFLGLGALLYLYAADMNIQASGDDLYPILATQSGLGMGLGIIFLLGLIAAAYSSADSALTSLTTAFCVDFLGMKEEAEKDDVKKRKWVHIAFSKIIKKCY